MEVYWIINSRKRSYFQISIQKLLYNNGPYSDKQSICNQLNNYFVRVGETSSDKIQASDIDPLAYIYRSCLKSFGFRCICECEVYDKILNLIVEKSAIGIPSTRLKLAASHIYEALTIVFNNSLQLGSCISRFFLKFLKARLLIKGVTSITKHPWKRFQNFRQSCVLSTDRIEIHQSQPLV